MKTRVWPHVVVGLAVLVLVGCAAEAPIRHESPVEVSGEKRVTTRQAFRNLVVGRTFSNDLGSGRCLADGTMTGEFGGRRLTGYWYWEDGFFCRDIRVGPEYLGSDCQIVLISEDELTVVRNRGNGEKVTYQLHAPGS